MKITTYTHQTRGRSRTTSTTALRLWTALCLGAALRWNVHAAGLGQPRLSSPGRAAIEVPVDVALDWKSVGGASRYEYEVWSPYARVHAGTTDKSTTKTLPLDFGTAYEWRVRGLAGKTRVGPWSETWRFRTLSRPGLILLGPPEGAVGTGERGNTVDEVYNVLRWQPVPGAARYEVQLRRGAEWSEAPRATTQSQFVHYGMDDTRYWWRVRADLRQGRWTDWSETRTFTTKDLPGVGPGSPPPQPGSVPVPMAPKEGRIHRAVERVVLRWSITSDVVRYRVEVYKDRSLSVLVAQADTVQTVYSLRLPAGSTYTWRVGAIGSDGAVRWSRNTFFSVDSK